MISQNEIASKVNSLTEVELKGLLSFCMADIFANVFGDDDTLDDISKYIDTEAKKSYSELEVE